MLQNTKNQPIYLVAIAILSISLLVVPAYADSISFSQSDNINANNKIIAGHSEYITYVGSSLGTVQLTGGVDGPMPITLIKKGSTNIYQKMVIIDTCPASNPATPKYCVANNSQITVTMSNLSDTATVVSSTASTVVGSPMIVSPTGCATNDDADNDGVCDSWEKGTQLKIPISGTSSFYTYTCDTTCDKSKPDVFVEIDYMTGHRPNQQAIDDVIAAFNSKGVRLHVQIDDEEQDINHSINTPFPGTTSQPGFDQIKAAHFGTPTERGTGGTNSEVMKSKRQVFHYVLFAHSQSSSASGIAEYLGNDAMITLGTFDGQIGSYNQQTGTFMHELGHNLNLDHDGNPSDGTAINCIPNYLSVMNYAYQTNDLIGGLTTSRPLDYSRMQIPIGTPLVESGLNESVGIDAYTPRPNAKMIWNKNPSGSSVAVKTGVPSSPLDWNGNGSTETNVGADLNYLGTFCTGSSGYQTLKGYDDWSNINYKFQDNASTFADGVSSSYSNADDEVRKTGCKTLPPQAADKVPNDLTIGRFCADQELTSENVKDMRSVAIGIVTNFEKNASDLVKIDTKKLKEAIESGEMDLAQELLNKTGLLGAQKQSIDESMMEEETPTPTPTPIGTSSDSAIIGGLIGLIIGLSAMAGGFAYAHNRPKTRRRN